MNPGDRLKNLIIALAVGALGCAGSLQGSTPSIQKPASNERAPRSPQKRKIYSLRADKTWQLENASGKRFDASGLIFTSDGALLTVNDKVPELWKIELSEGPTAKLTPTGLFTRAQLAPLGRPKQKDFDCEGIGRDEQGRLYLSEESDRAIFRTNPASKSVERLPIDWSPVSKFFQGDKNASFEGVAVGNGRLYVANERSQPRIIVVDLATMKVIDNYYVDASGFAFGGPHYSDLAFYDGDLFVLDRNHRCILQVDVKLRAVVAEFNFGAMELERDVAYRTDFPTGTMEGLAVDKDYFWLVTDNNGKARFSHPDDERPTLFRCKRPDVRGS